MINLRKPQVLIHLIFTFAVTVWCDKNCADSEYECCPDGQTPATGEGFKGCSQESVKTIQEIIGTTNETAENVCRLPEPINTCFDYKMQWRYSTKHGRCIQYWYGGCDGNANSFDTLEQCEGKCIKPNGTDVCKLDLVNPIGICQYNLTRFYYDAKTSMCKEFLYTGCLGNANNFETIQECERKCQTPILFDQCSFAPEKGPCQGSYQRWYYNSKKGRCEIFSYGGCLKNQNNFKAQEECVETCVKPKQKALCLLPKIRGNCDQNVESYYYDINQGKCMTLSYSGCNGNLNRFETPETCEYTCQGLSESGKSRQLIDSEICNAPKLTGMCHLKLQRWYFNRTTMMCHQFTYSGCDSNGNNFENEEDCRKSCNAREVEPCVLPVESGTCADYKIFWYFNQAEKECVRFYYGGCDGNQNRFENRENCEFTCKLSEAEKTELLKLPKSCITPVEYGSECISPVRKYHYDINMKICYPYDYTGCDTSETANRFDTNKECQEICVNANTVPNNQEEINEVVLSADFEPNSELFICDLPMESGNCSQRVNKWYYDQHSKYCREFQFTGCNGNGNKFETRKQCTQICEQPKRREICHSNKFQGPCHDFEQRWYHDAPTKSCQQFKYGGCLANENNFHTKSACMHFCWMYLSEEARLDTTDEATTPSVATTIVTEPVDICKLPWREGTACGVSAVEKWYYDQTIRACQKSTYRGCDGNANNFDSQLMCEQECTENTPILDISNLQSENSCDDYIEISEECLDVNTSDILASMTFGNDVTWFYDIETRNCRQIKSTCIVDAKANTNKFDSFESCRSECLTDVSQEQTQNDCLLPMDIGNKCTYQIWRWYYDSKAGECHQFSYSGCLGNNNNFPTIQTCLWLCASVANQCPLLESCNKTCQYGRIKSLTGCELCECADPCKNFQCNDENQQCVVIDSQAVCESSPIDPDIEDFPLKLEVFKGSKLVLPCKVTGHPPPVVTWFKDHHEITFKAFDGKMFLGQNNTLIITKMSTEDEGIFSCRASSLGKSVVKETTVRIEAPAYLSRTVSSYEKFGRFGRDLTIECYITGHPPPQFTWRTDKYKIKPNPYKYIIAGNKLTIKRYHYSDVGNYICSATNGKQTPISQTITTKYAIPGKVKFKSYNINAELNTTVLLKCDHSGTPAPDITWYTPDNDTIIIATSNHQRLRIVNGSFLEIKRVQETDSGIYKCNAINKFTHKFMRNRLGKVNLTVYSPPVIVSKFGKFYSPIASNILLKCESEGLPKPEITWYKDNTLILSKEKTEPSFKYNFSLQNGSLAIFDLNSNDEGVYYCYASSLAIFPVSSLNYTVKVIKSLVKKSLTHRVNETADTLLNCHIPDEAEILKISWTLNETIKLNTPVSYSDLYTLNNIGLDDAGVYECYAETNSTNYLTVIEMEVVALPVSVESRLKQVASVKGSSTILDCTWWFTTNSLDKNNIPDNLTTWKVNGTRIRETIGKHEFLDSYKTILKVDNLGLHDSGDMYICEFNLKKNEIKISNFSLFIGVPPFVLSNSALKNNNSIIWNSDKEPITIECPLSGIPPVTKHWYFNNKPIETSTNQLEINNQTNTLLISRLDQSSEGTFMCNASNQFGSEILQYDLQLAVEMKIIEPIDNLIKAEAGDNIVIICYYNKEARPEPIVTWLFNNVPIRHSNQKYSGKKNIISISNVNVNDTGYYTCILSNGYHPEQRFDYRLEVEDTPAIRFIPTSPVFKVGDKGKITCTLDKHQDDISRVFWYKNTDLLKDSDRYLIDGTELNILNVQMADQGRYICKIRIGRAYIRGRVNVKVLVTDKVVACEDIWSYSNCQVVRTQMLCSKWSKFCCRTCSTTDQEVI